MPSILKHWVGESFWPWPNDHIRETRKVGPSIRINPQSVPDLTPPYPVVFSHPKGTFQTTKDFFSLEDLFTECSNEGHLHPDLVHENCIDFDLHLPKLLFITTLEGLYKNDRTEWHRLVKKYGLSFAPAVTHYSYITVTQVVIGDGEEGWDMVEQLKMAGHDVEPVKVVPID